MTVKEYFAQFGYDVKTTFWEDFSIAEKYGVDEIKDTYNRAFNEWKTNTEYITELAMILNHKGWQWYEKDDDIAKVYFDLWEKCDGWCMDNLKDDALDYYISTTD